MPRARQMLERARWATRAFATYDRDSVLRIVEAVTRAAEENAEQYAEWAVRETGFGVVADKVVKNRLCSRGILDAYRDHDYVTPRVDAERKIVEVPRPAGRRVRADAVDQPGLDGVLQGHPVAADPQRGRRQPAPGAPRSAAPTPPGVLAEAAVAAGAPDGVVQWVEEPSVPLIDALMTDPRTDVILATGGVAVVRAAYSSGNPAIGVGPGNVPGARRRHRRPRPRREEARRQQGVRQLRALHQRERADRRGGRRGPAAARDEPARRPPPRRRRARPGPRRGLPRRAVRHLDGRPGRGHDRRAGRRTRSAEDPGAARAVRPGRQGGAARAREALPGARRDARAQRPPRHPHRGGAAAHRRRRPLRGDPQQRRAHRHGVRRRGRRAPRDGQRGRQHRQRRLHHQPGPVDDHRHRLRRPQLAQREPPAQAPGQPHPDRLQHGPERGAAVVRRRRAVGRADRSGAGVPAREQPGTPTASDARPPSTLRSEGTEEIREELRRLIIEELTSIIKG